MKKSVYDIIQDIAQLKAIELYDLCTMLNISAGDVLQNLGKNLQSEISFRIRNPDKNNYQKIQFIKGIREQTGLGLKEAKEVSEGSRSLKVQNYSNDQIRKIREYADTFGYESYPTNK